MSKRRLWVQMKWTCPLCGKRDEGRSLGKVPPREMWVNCGGCGGEVRVVQGDGFVEEACDSVMRVIIESEWKKVDGKH